MLSAAELIRLLDLKPHPEGGHFRETFRDPRKVDGARAASTVAYYLLARGERSHWHKVMRSKPGFTTQAHRSSSRSRRTRRGRSSA